MRSCIVLRAILLILALLYFIPLSLLAQQDSTHQCILSVSDRTTPMAGVRIDVNGNDSSSTWAVTDTGGIAAFAMIVGVEYNVFVHERGYQPADFMVYPGQWNETARMYEVEMMKTPRSKHFYALALFDSCSVSLRDTSLEEQLGSALDAYGDEVHIEADVIYYHDSIECNMLLAGERLDIIFTLLESHGFVRDEIKLEWRPYEPIKIKWMGSGFPIGSVLDESFIGLLKDPAMQEKARLYNRRIEIHLSSF